MLMNNDNCRLRLTLLAGSSTSARLSTSIDTCQQAAILKAVYDSNRCLKMNRNMVMPSARRHVRWFCLSRTSISTPNWLNLGKPRKREDLVGRYFALFRT